mmetsp:Transcript_45672/g.105502  ORF Transcript_45672/g.105502 Transcript_45672/m.105502 type:complete len:526 (+) Transcript_45672:66-1643(+)
MNRGFQLALTLCGCLIPALTLFLLRLLHDEQDIQLRFGQGSSFWPNVTMEEDNTGEARERQKWRLFWRRHSQQQLAKKAKESKESKKPKEPKEPKQRKKSKQANTMEPGATQEGDWRSARVYKRRRCSRELDSFGTRMVAQRRCDADSNCKGLMFYRKDNIRGDGREACDGWYQLCGGTVASITNSDWDVIEKPVGKAVVANARSEELGPPHFMLWLETKGGTGNQILQLIGLLGLAKALNETHPKASVSIGLSKQHAAVPRSQNFDTWDSVLRSFKHWLVPRPSSSADCDCSFEESVTTSEPFSRSWNFPNEEKQPWGEDWSATLASELARHFHRCKYVKVGGFFQDRRYYEKVLPRLRELFWHKPSVRRAEEELAQLGVHRDSWDLTISVHYRLGDVTGGWEVRDDYFPEAVDAARQRLGGSRKLTCVIFSDTPELAWNRSLALTSCKRRVAAPQLDVGINFYMMALIPHGVLTLSSFSYTAALVGRKKVVIVPDVKFRMFDYLKQHDWVALKTSMKGCSKFC